MPAHDYLQNIFGRDADKNPYAQVNGRSRPNTHSSSLQRLVPTPQQLIDAYRTAEAAEKAKLPTLEQRRQSALERRSQRAKAARAQRRMQSA